ncbi:RICIN domain-containing protein [Microbacterium sp. X-17]|uniref:RICIN domain-containing protein n=1 Tax=Microbacterium sp. X-17 TaxID=3144404 RepID=UPI0031F4BFA8
MAAPSLGALRRRVAPLLNPQSGLCLDDPGGSVTPGTQLQIYTCNGLPAQQFPIH